MDLYAIIAIALTLLLTLVCCLGGTAYKAGQDQGLVGKRKDESDE